ncbi:MAG: hypothetical protein BJ554DRAFT_6415, partial [Olpidium bornovanus]
CTCPAGLTRARSSGSAASSRSSCCSRWSPSWAFGGTKRSDGGRPNFSGQLATTSFFFPKKKLAQMRQIPFLPLPRFTRALPPAPPPFPTHSPLPHFPPFPHSPSSHSSPKRRK